MYPGSITLRSGINQKTLVTIDTNNTDLWKSFKIYTPALSIVVSSYFNLQLDASDKTVDNWISNGFVGQKGIIAAPAFNGFFSADYGTLFSFNPNSCQTDSETCGINFEVNSTDYQSVKYTVNNGVENFFEQSNNITLFGTSVDEP
uniref:Uncharacterized protein n=1 Tax=Panagrolaimus sp. ES5 TaxID=591445 RepID=A0AC34FEK5_9BILA